MDAKELGELPADPEDIGEIEDDATPAKEVSDSQPDKETPSKEEAKAKPADGADAGDETPKETPEEYSARVQKRIDKIKAETASERQAGKQKDDVISAQKAILDALNIKPEEIPQPPKMSDFESEDDFDAAMSVHQQKVTAIVTRNTIAETVSKATQKVSVDETAVRRESFTENLKGSFKSEEEFAKFATDANAVQALGANGNEDLHRAIWSAPHGTEILKYLTSHPGEANRIAALDPVSIGMEIGNLSGRISAAPVEVSGAPPPVSHLGIGPRSDNSEDDDDPMDDINKEAVKYKI